MRMWHCLSEPVLFFSKVFFTLAIRSPPSSLLVIHRQALGAIERFTLYRRCWEHFRFIVFYSMMASCQNLNGTSLEERERSYSLAIRCAPGAFGFPEFLHCFVGWGAFRHRFGEKWMFERFRHQLENCWRRKSVERCYIGSLDTTEHRS